jgi:hypothetical protein
MVSVEDFQSHQWIEADFRTEKVREEIGDEVYFLHGTEHQDH